MSLMSANDWEALANTYLDDLEIAKEASGYNAYLETRKDKDGFSLHHWTFKAYLLNLRSRAEKA